MLTTVSTRSIVTAAVAVRVSDVAVIVAEPSDSAVTKPLSETIAIVVSDEDQATLNSARVLPPASSAVAVRVRVSPETLNVRESLDSARVIAICSIVTVAVALAEPEAAVIMADPLPAAVTRPSDDTVAIEEEEEDHDKLALPIVAPFWSSTVALRLEVSPSDENVRFVCDSVTVVATGAGGVEDEGGAVGFVSSFPQAASKTIAASRIQRISKKCRPGILFNRFVCLEPQFPKHRHTRAPKLHRARVQSA